MYKVFTGDGRQYVGFSTKLAEEFFEAAVNSGRFVMMMQRIAGEWTEIKEGIPVW